jgi:hypothetical protein
MADIDDSGGTIPPAQPFDYFAWAPSSKPQFDLSGLPPPAPIEPAPPPDPAVLQQQRIIDNTAAEDALTNYINAKQQVLYEGPDPFYGKQGADAVRGAPSTLDTLNRMRNQALDGMANDAQRRKLGGALDAHMDLDQDDIARHVAAQSLAWQRQVAQDRIDALNKAAALQHNDDGLVDAMGNAAAGAERTRLTLGGTPADTDVDAAAAKAKSGVYHAAILGHLDRGNTDGATVMFDRVSDQLDPGHAAELDSQLATARRLDAAKTYAAQLVPHWSASHDEADAQHESATQQNQAANQADPAYQAEVQRVLDVQHATQKRGIDDAAAERAQAIADWLGRKGPNGEPQTRQPPPSLRNRLTPAEQAALDKQLVINARGLMPVRTLAMV